MPHSKKKSRLSPLAKTSTGISGLDEITGGGLPQGRSTLVCGGAGCGKTLLAMEFIVQGAANFDEPGIFMAFEETTQDLSQNVATLGFALDDLVRRKKLVVDHVRIERSEIEETGAYDLEGLFIRLAHAVDSIHAKRIALDTREVLFGNLQNPMILRAELRRLLRWFKERNLTAIITGERGASTLTRYGFEEYISDCVILLDHRVDEQISTRRLRVVKYRGSTHGANEYPFLIDETGISVLPVTSLSLEHQVSNERISTGVPDLDGMLGGKGYFRGSSILISGAAGTGKTSLCAAFVDAACRRGERVLYFAFEESVAQIERNMQSIGIDLGPWVRKGLLKFQNQRPTHFGLELHLATMHKLIEAFKPRVIIVDPITNFISVGSPNEITGMLTRLVDYLKANQITALFTSLIHSNAAGQSKAGVSSLMDAWLLLRNAEMGGERTRRLSVLKARGMAHSNQIREFELSDNGIRLCNVDVGPHGISTSSTRLTRQAQEIDHKRRKLKRKRQVVKTQIAALRAELQNDQAELQAGIEQAQVREAHLAEDRQNGRTRSKRNVKNV